ncbi:MAG TPA: molecular chaperone DnaK [Elusimicrobiota bacterium]|nr:molecular chaperone DnaK [Elusimicrobiota bacterium]HNG44985.1 molecular chaperone DnaK [Elusimicrobiota bacterium]
MAKIIGIDLGTSNSAAAVMEGGKPVIIPSAEGTTMGGKAFPSYVAFTKDEQLVVGEPARRQAVSNPEGTVFAFKRKMGQDYKYSIHGKTYTPQQLSAFILQKIKRDAEAYLGEKVEKAVITVPAYFDDNQRQATKDAGQIAGLEVVRLVNEPTAASLAYGLDKIGQAQKILVFDLGGGTLDVTIMEMGYDKDIKAADFKVLATSGDTQLGGTDMDNVLIDFIAEEFRKENGIDLRKDKLAMQRFKEAAEKAKIELSTVLETEINLPYITGDASGAKHLQMKLSRAKLESLVQPIIDRCKHPMEEALKGAGLSASAIGKVVMVGGPTRMPCVLKFVESFVGRKIEGGVNPMECVALGAAVQAGVLSSDVKDVLLLDVTPLTLGIETLGGVMTPLIKKNTTIPTRASQVFSTAADNQEAVTVHVLQGEREVASGNTSLGHFNLDGIPLAPRGTPQIEVTFDIDANGILNVTALDKGTQKKQHITIEAKNKLSKEEVEKFIKDAELHAEEDKKKKEEIETKNEADAIVFSTEKALKEYGDKVSQEERMAIERALTDAKEALKGGDLAKIKKTKEDLLKASHKLAEEMYKAASAKAGEGAPGAQGGPSNGAGNGKGGGDNVVDAEVVDEGKK